MRDAGHRTPDAGHRTSDGEKSKNNISTPQGGGHNSAGIANRVKPHLDYLISNPQTDFLTGRYIGENACLVYDILHETEKN